jgi:5'-deoxynucleotidase YfbR-like HD superfamily hydrolase
MPELINASDVEAQLPPKKQRRFNQLRRKLQNETISERGYEELLSLWQEVERRNVEMLRALIELAKLRGVSVQDLMRQLGIGENTDVF